MTSAENPTEVTYGRRFYEFVDSSSTISAGAVVPLLVEWFDPCSVVDVGCGTGGWLAQFAEHGVSDVLGINDDRVPPDLLKLAPERFIAADLTDPPDVRRVFDLAVCLEVAEHLDESSAATLVRYLVSLAPVVVFSAAIPGQGGEDHLNEQWPRYWAELFHSAGLECFDVLRPHFWEDERVDWFYRQNMLVYARSEVLECGGALSGVARFPAPPIALVHPAALASTAERLERLRTTPLSMRAHLRQLPRATAAAVRHRLGRRTP